MPDGSATAVRGGTRLTTRVTLILVAIVLLATFNAALAFYAASERSRARDASTDLRAMSAAATVLAQSAIDQETDQRGFLITGDTAYLEQFEKAGERVDASLERLRRLSADDPEVARHLRSAGTAMAAWRDHAANVEIRTREVDGVEAAADVVSTGKGTELFDQLRDDNDALQAEIETQLQAARDRSTEAYDRFVLIVSITLAAVVAMAVALAVALSRWLTRPVERLATSVGEVQAGHLDHPVDISGPRELVEIGTAVEEMRKRLVAELDRSRAASEELAQANAELEAFSYSVSHDLRAPLRSIDGFSQALVEDAGDQLDEVALAHFSRIRAATQRMGALIDDLLTLSRVSRVAPVPVDVDISAVAQAVVDDLAEAHPDRVVEVDIQPGLRARADLSLVQVVFENLLGNAWKFTSQNEVAHIAVRGSGAPPGTTFTVTDDGAGFDQKYADKLFSPFQRLHTDREFPGTGIGLATVARIVRRHGGHIRADGVVGAGATMTFTLARDPLMETTDAEPQS
jgi:signal transduction histidine kinase